MVGRSSRSGSGAAAANGALDPAVKIAGLPPMKWPALNSDGDDHDDGNDDDDDDDRSGDTTTTPRGVVTCFTLPTSPSLMTSLVVAAALAAAALVGVS